MMSSPLSHQKRVLVIAEDHIARSRIVELFEQGGYAVLVAHDSVEVLAVVDRQRPDVVVLHATLPSRMGLDVLRPLRNRRPPTLIPAILVSADASVVLDSDSHRPRILSNQPIALHDLVAHVDQLTLAS